MNQNNTALTEKLVTWLVADEETRRSIYTRQTFETTAARRIEANLVEIFGVGTIVERAIFSTAIGQAYNQILSERKMTAPDGRLAKTRGIEKPFEVAHRIENEIAAAGRAAETQFLAIVQSARSGHINVESVIRLAQQAQILKTLEECASNLGVDGHITWTAAKAWKSVLDLHID